MATTHVPPEPALPRPRAATAGAAEAPQVLAGLWIVLACREAERGVAPAIRTLAACAARTSADYEIVVVDGTARSVVRFVDAAGPVRLLVHPHPRGYGAAVRAGLGAARMPWVLLATADEALDPPDMPGFAALTPSADVVVGRRIRRTDAVLRRIAGAAWNRLMRALFGLPVHDVDCAFKLIRADVLDRIELQATGPVVAAELVVRCRAVGACVAEYPLIHRPVELGPRPRIRIGGPAGATSSSPGRSLGASIAVTARRPRSFPSPMRYSAPVPHSSGSADRR